MSLYNDILKKLRKTGTLDLMEYRNLSNKEIEKMGAEIRYWCTYGNGKLEKLGRDEEGKKSRGTSSTCTRLIGKKICWYCAL